MTRSAPVGSWTVIGLALATNFVQQPNCSVNATYTAVADLSSPPGDTDLGELAQECSRHCNAGISALDLWLSLEEVCISADTTALLRELLGGTEAQPAVLVVSSPPSPSSVPSAEMAAMVGISFSEEATGSTPADTYWSLVQSIVVCVTVAVLGLFVGFRKGYRMSASVLKVAEGAFCSLP